MVTVVRRPRGRIVSDIIIGVTSALAASFLFQSYVTQSIHEIELKKFNNSMKIIENYCDRYSGWYSPEDRSIDAFQIHRIPGIPDPIIEGAIESLRIIGERDENAYTALYRMSQIYKKDLLNYILNEDTVRQWRAHRYYQSLDYICAWAGVKSNVLCAGGDSVVLKESGPAMVYYYGSKGGEVVSCDSQKIYDSYAFPELK
jgi:hypothetical protein